MYVTEDKASVVATRQEAPQPYTELTNMSHNQSINQFLDHLPAEVSHAFEGMDFPTAFHCYSAKNTE